MKVLKFGGSSLAAPERVRAVCDIVAAARVKGDVAVVVSAFGGVTDGLLVTARAAARKEEGCRGLLADLERRHLRAARDLALEEERDGLQEEIRALFRELGELIQGVFALGEASPRTLDGVLSAGERLSAPLVAAALRRSGLEAEACDARRLVVTGPEFGAARVREEPTHERIRGHFREAGPIQVVTGFIGATVEGDTTTLGRGGSDYTASILGAALGAEAVELWTDVDGVLSADPRVVAGARLTERLSYDELMELSHFGAKVVHPPSIRPIRSRSIPLWIKNTFRPDAPGTCVTCDGVPPDAERSSPVVGIASIPSVALMRLEGDGMVGVPGIAMRLFGALARRGVSVIMISQASSEHSICFAVAPGAIAAAAEGVEEEFEVERRAGLIDDLVIERDLSVIAAVGSGMRERAGIAGKLFGVLGRHGVNVRAIAQGSSELNISLVVASSDEARAINAIHEAFFRRVGSEVEIFLAGVGRVGGKLLDQIAARTDALERERGLRLRLAGVADSRGAILDPEGIDPALAIERLKDDGEPSPHDALRDAAARNGGGVRILVDCTGGDEIPGWYEGLLGAGAAVVTANKRLLAGPLEDYRRIVGAGRLHHEATVGAGLPVVRTLRDLVATGDRIRKIEGVLSGTLGFVMSEVGRGEPFSLSVWRAHERGYTEPDPREDLTGRDVARKLLILGRLAGWELEPDQVEVESLILEDYLNRLPLDEFWRQLPLIDDLVNRRRREAEAEERRLVYLASLSQGRARVALEAVEAAHPCAAVGGTDNLIAVTSDRYPDSPLIVSGPGAGPDVTAAGVFGDILRAIAEAGDGGS